MSQELLKSILYLINHIADREINSEAIQTLEIIIDKKWNELDINAKQEIYNCICSYVEKNKNNENALQCLHRITMAEEFPLNQSVLNIIMENVTKNLEIAELSLDILHHLARRDFQFAIKFIEFSIENNIKLSDVINETLATPKLYGMARKYLSFIAFIISIQNPIIQNYLQLDDIVNNLKIPKLFEF